MALTDFFWEETDLRHVFAFYGEIVSVEHIDEACPFPWVLQCFCRVTNKHQKNPSPEA